MNLLQSDHLYELSVALVARCAVVVLQELSQQGAALLHLLNGVDPLRHLLCSLLILREAGGTFIDRRGVATEVCMNGRNAEEQQESKKE